MGGGGERERVVLYGVSIVVHSDDFVETLTLFFLCCFFDFGSFVKLLKDGTFFCFINFSISSLKQEDRLSQPTREFVRFHHKPK